MRTLLFTIMILAAASLSADEPVKEQPMAADSTEMAPDFEMATYYMVFLRVGPNFTAEQTSEQQEIFMGHMQHINTHVDSGYIVVAGPFASDDASVGALAGMCIYRVDSKETAEMMVHRDPAVKTGRFTAEVMGWMGPKSLKF